MRIGNYVDVIIMDIKVNLCFFAKSRELTGVSQTTLYLSSSSFLGKEIVDKVVSAYPQLAVLEGRFLLSVNHEFVDKDQFVTLHQEDEIAIIPPISGGLTVVQLEYEAYNEMAMKQMMQICLNIRKKWKINRIAVVHRIGIVPVKEPSVIIAASSEHRQEAIEAVSFAIDSIKSIATIWKKEVYKEGTAEWKENKECAWSSQNQY